MSRLPAVRILRTLDEVRALAPRWEALHREAESDNPFLTPAWTLGWLETGEGIEPYVVAGFLDDELVAVWPLARTRTPLGRVLGYVEGDAYGLVHRGELPSSARALVAAVVADCASWDALYLNEHFAAAPEHEALLAAFHDAGIHVASLPTSSCPELVFSDRAAFECHVGKKVLREVRKRRRQLEQLGPVRVEELRTVDEVDRGFSALAELHDRRWHDRSDTSAFADPVRTTGMRAAAMHLAAAGQLAIDLLLVDEVPVAGCYGLRSGGRFIYYTPGFDPAWAPYSVSKILLLHQMERCLREGSRAFDFSRGLEPYKMVWATAVRSAMTVVGHHDSPRGRLLAATLRGRIEAVNALKSREAIVHFKRETLGKLRHALTPATWLDQVHQKSRAVRRSLDDRGYGGTTKHIALRLVAPLQARLVTRLYQRQLDESCTPPVLPVGTTMELLTPSGFAMMRDTGRHSLHDVVRRHYAGHCCYLARIDGQLASYLWVASGRPGVAATPVAVPELGGELPLAEHDIYPYDSYTFPAFRGRKLHLKLLEHAAALAVQGGHRRALTVILDDNLPPIKNIERLGYTLARRVEVRSRFGRVTTRELRRNLPTST